MKLKPEKFEPMTCDTDAVPYQMSYQANWEQFTLWAANIPLDDKELRGLLTWREGAPANQGTRLTELPWES